VTVTTKKTTVADQLLDVGRSLSAFGFEGEQYLSRTVGKTMKEAKAAFADDDYDRAEHLAKVVAYLVKREAPKFAADPRKWIERRRELRK
jgi:hypothetical protein